jgi:hypothetical protein
MLQAQHFQAWENCLSCAEGLSQKVGQCRYKTTALLFFALRSFNEILKAKATKAIAPEMTQKTPKRRNLLLFAVSSWLPKS